MFPDTLERLELLIDRSLLQREGSRYRLLSSVRLLLEAQGAPPPDCIKRHAAYFVARAPTWLQMFNGARCMQAQRELSDVEADLIAAWEAEIPPSDAMISRNCWTRSTRRRGRGRSGWRCSGGR